MAKIPIRLDSAGIAEVLNRPEVDALVVDATHRVAANVRAAGYKVEVVIEPARPGARIKDGRPVGRVTIAESGGVGIQAKTGVLTKAAMALGTGVQIRKRA